jgi:hypothetical protein
MNSNKCVHIFFCVLSIDIHIMMLAHRGNIIPFRVTVFWDVVPYNLVQANRCFMGPYCLRNEDEMSVNFYDATDHNMVT